jgi:hypothetical protein
MTCNEEQERPNQRQKDGHERAEPPLQPAWRADADQLPHEEPKIETTRVDQQSLQNVGVRAKVHAAHPAGLVEMREGPLQALPTQPQQAQAACAPRMRRRLRYTAARASGFFFFQFRRLRSGSEM